MRSVAFRKRLFTEYDLEGILLVTNIIKKLYICIRDFFSPMGFWGSYVSFPCKMRLRKLGIGSDYYKKIEEIKGKYNGGRCFIIATGPSLTIRDVSLLKKEITIGENSIFKIYDQLGWVPTYYVMTDPTLTRKIINNNKGIVFDDFAVEKCIFNSLNIKDINCKKGIFVDCNWLDHVYHYGESRKFKFNDDLKYGVYDCYSVTQECIIYAMYMGFSEIYILGADNDYLGKKQHFASYGGETSIEYDKALKMQKANDLGYEFVKSIADSKNIKIFNATRGGNINCFARVNLDEIIADRN